MFHTFKHCLLSKVRLYIYFLETYILYVQYIYMLSLINISLFVTLSFHPAITLHDLDRSHLTLRSNCEPHRNLEWG